MYIYNVVHVQFVFSEGYNWCQSRMAIGNELIVVCNHLHINTNYNGLFCHEGIRVFLINISIMASLCLKALNVLSNRDFLHQ